MHLTVTVAMLKLLFVRTFFVADVYYQDFYLSHVFVFSAHKNPTEYVLKLRFTRRKTAQEFAQINAAENLETVPSCWPPEPQFLLTCSVAVLTSH